MRGAEKARPGVEAIGEGRCPYFDLTVIDVMIYSNTSSGLVPKLHSFLLGGLGMRLHQQYMYTMAIICVSLVAPPLALLNFSYPVNCGSAFVEVAVSEGSSDNFITLLPQSTLMTVSDSRARWNRTRSVSYKRDKLSVTASGQKWSRVKLICRQPFNNADQFGLQFVAFYSNTATGDAPSRAQNLTVSSHTSALLSPPATPSPSFASPAPGAHVENATLKLECDKTCSNERRWNERYPSLPSQGSGIQSPIEPRAARSHGNSARTPKRPLREREEENEANERGCEVDFEFSGLEEQSRLFKNAMRGKPSGQGDTETNPILEKIMQEKEKYRKSRRTSDGSGGSGGYERRRLVRAELPKAEGSVDFASSFTSGAHSNKDVADAWGRVACLGGSVLHHTHTHPHSHTHILMHSQTGSTRLGKSLTAPGAGPREGGGEEGGRVALLPGATEGG